MHRRKHRQRRSCEDSRSEVAAAQRQRPKQVQQGPRWDWAKRRRCPGSGFGQYIDKESPSENVSLVHAVRNVPRGRWSGRNLRQTCRTRAEGYRRRGIAPRPCARERQNSGPYCLQCRKEWAPASIVRKYSYEERCGKAISRTAPQAGDHPIENVTASSARGRFIGRSNAVQRNRRQRELLKSGGTTGGSNR
jgi:hypothetical protein